MLVALHLLACIAAAQILPPAEPLPPELVLDDLREAYAGTIAEEMVVRYRGPQATERSETIVVRIDPGHDPARRPQKMYLELGQLRVLLTHGEMTAINRTAPGRYFAARYQGSITPEVIALLLPPLPLPQLALATGDDPFSSPTPYTHQIAWTSAVAEPDARPPTMRMVGAGPRSSVIVTANVNTARLMRLESLIRTPAGDARLDLSIRAIDPGNPDLWLIDTGGRQRVDSLAELRPTVRLGPIPVGEPVPDLSFTYAETSPWRLYSALRAAEAVAPPGEAPQPVALILLRITAEPAQVEDRLREAHAAATALARRQRRPAQIAVAGITTLGDFNPDRWNAARAAWLNLLQRQPIPGHRDELLRGHAPGQTIDIFAPDAVAILIMVNADRTLGSVLRLDGLSSAQITAALRDPPAHEPGGAGAPPPEEGR
jgi:hypothetical protein